MFKAAIPLVLMLIGSLATPAGAAGATVYHGTWTGAEASGPCSFLTGDYSGHWNVTLKADGTAEVSMVAFRDRGVIHAAWGGNAFQVTWTQQNVVGTLFSLTSPNPFVPGTNSFVLSDDGKLTYTIQPMCNDGSPAYMYGKLR